MQDEIWHQFGIQNYNGDVYSGVVTELASDRYFNISWVSNWTIRFVPVVNLLPTVHRMFYKLSRGASPKTSVNKCPFTKSHFFAIECSFSLKSTNFHYKFHFVPTKFAFPLKSAYFYQKYFLFSTLNSDIVHKKVLFFHQQVPFFNFEVPKTCLLHYKLPFFKWPSRSKICWTSYTTVQLSWHVK